MVAAFVADRILCMQCFDLKAGSHALRKTVSQGVTLAYAACIPSKKSIEGVQYSIRKY